MLACLGNRHPDYWTPGAAAQDLGCFRRRRLGLQPTGWHIASGGPMSEPEPHPARPASKRPARPDYNRFAGGSLDRLAALSDGVSAVAMTLLVFDLHAPAAAAIPFRTGPRDIAAAARAAASRLSDELSHPRRLLGRQQTQLNHLARADRDISWIHLAFLFAVTLMPFSTSLVSEFIRYRTALVGYWLNILLLGALLWVAWRYARRAGLVADEVPQNIARAIECRIAVAEGFYAFGALLSVFDTYWSIGFIVLVQLNYGVAPRLGRWRRAQR
jgi:uncharacterized membrane protein